MATTSTGKPRDIVISVMGGAGLYPMGMGEARNAYHLIRNRYPHRRICFSGVSSGSWVALMLALDIQDEQIEPYFTYFRSLFDAWYKTRYFYWFKNLELLTRKILEENGGYKKVSNKLFIGMTSFDPSDKRFKFNTVCNYKSNDDVIDAIMASSHLFIVGRSWFRYYENRFSFDGNFLKPNVILDDGQYINILIKYRFRFDNKSPWDSMVSYCPQKWHRLYTEGANKFEQNKLKYLEQVERNQVLPDSYYTDGFLPDFHTLLPAEYRRKRRISAFLFMVILIYYAFTNRAEFFNQFVAFLLQFIL
eukprot:CAMPEP_0197045068 /NCGR_PEP_ID=MMETSP1384-20130603/21003_1 /TAXON_ID=29189 /ORGANISM="Ammonia sp." /LENGTH=304 /DNA_ID=CAMNT_0042476623 /DNA_START=62 /DNA_END=976 /DNA_ORIENTATION=+